MDKNAAWTNTKRFMDTVDVASLFSNAETMEQVFDSGSEFRIESLLK